MPGTNHDVEPGFMDELPFSLRDAALDLLNYSSLKEILEVRAYGPTPYLRKTFTHSQEEWHVITRAVLLTKISYFTLNTLYPTHYIDHLTKLALHAYGLPSGNLVELYQAVHSKYPYFADWLKKALETKKNKLRLEQAQKLKAEAAKG
jgi:uncharacterized protein YeaO (DUF488 family)